MLIKFIVGNFKVFKEKATLDMRASSISDHAQTHIHTIEENKLLKSAAIYGKNAAGKSKLIHALEFMQTFVIESSKDRQSNDAIETDPFRLHTETRNAPSFFEIQFLLEGIQYRYGFEVTTQRIEKEWLLEQKTKKEYPLFLRIQDAFEIDLNVSPKEKEKKVGLEKTLCFFLWSLN